jgi:hypothetical protein
MKAIMKCLHKCRFNLNQTNDVDNITEISPAKDDRLGEKAISFPEYVSCDNDVNVRHRP